MMFVSLSLAVELDAHLAMIAKEAGAAAKSWGTLECIDPLIQTQEDAPTVE